MILMDAMVGALTEHELNVAKFFSYFDSNRSWTTAGRRFIWLLKWNKTVRNKNHWSRYPWESPTGNVFETKNWTFQLIKFIRINHWNVKMFLIDWLNEYRQQKVCIEPNNEKYKLWR